MGRRKDPTCPEQSPPPSIPLLAVTSFINMLLQGPSLLEDSASEYLYDASLTALLNLGGGEQPIAVGVTWHRLAGKLAVNYVSERARTVLDHTQLGFGVKGGAEAAAHLMRRFVSNTFFTSLFCLSLLSPLQLYAFRIS